MRKYTETRIRRTLGSLSVLVLTIMLSACLDTDEPIIVAPEAGSLFERYVSLGNSITAGFQSGGINVSLQQDAYPVLLADRAGAPFGIPALAMPGCPPPFVGPLTTERISEEPCGLRVFSPPAVVQNLAVPGATIADASDAIGTGTTLNTLILGGRTQVGAMIDARPSMVSVWLGNNDVLAAALQGDISLMTPIATFQAEYQEVVDAIQQTPAQAVVLIGVSNPMQAAPALQPGAYFWALAQNPPPGLPNLQVSDNCAPFTPTGTPNPGGFRLVSFLALAAQLEAGADPVIIDCSENAPGLLNIVEIGAITQQIGAFNAVIQQHAAANDWVYVDPATSLVAPALADPDQVRKCQLLPTATTPQEFAAAVLNSCPVDLDPGTPLTFFGTFISDDGVHPSGEGHAFIADVLAQRLNAEYGLSLPTGGG
jgi:lysophospholipase L1-like esterase